MGTPGGTADAPHKKTVWLESLAIIVSVIAIGASIYTAIASKNTSEAVAQFQAGAETDRSRAEFKREQRQVAYATFLAKEQAYLTAAVNYFGSYPDGVGTEEFSKANDAYGEAAKDLNLAINMIVILGSQDQHSGAGEAEAAAVALGKKFWGYADEASNNPQNGSMPYIEGGPEISALEESFVAAAKRAIDE